MKTVYMFAMPGEAQGIVGGLTRFWETAGTDLYAVGNGAVVCVGGVGKVNAAMAAQAVIDLLKPDLIVNAGIAGSMREETMAKPVLIHTFVQHDVDTTGVGDEIGMVSTVEKKTFVATGYDTIEKIMQKKGIDHGTGRLATGDWFMVDGARRKWVEDMFRPDYIDMEAGAIAQVCYRNDTKFASVKTISDCITGDGTRFGYKDGYTAAVERLDAVMKAVIEALAEV